LKTDSQPIIDQLSDLGKKCDGWARTKPDDRSCPLGNEPTWAFTARHTASSSKSCEPITYLLCDQCHKLAWDVLLVHRNKTLWCGECGERGLVVPDSYVIRDVRL
jgi:hypothetical protein